MIGILLQLLQSLPMTALLWFAAQVLGLLLAVPIAACRMSRNRWLRTIAVWYIEIFRGIPTLVLLFIVFFGLSSAGFNLTSVIASILALGVSASAYQAESIRSGFEAVPIQQYEAAIALSLPRGIRLSKVLLPQAMPVVLEGLVAFSIQMLKETALASLLGVAEVMSIAYYLVQRGVDGTIVFAITGLLYLILCVLLAGIAGLIGRRAGTSGKKAKVA